MSCNCGKPKCNGKCGISPAVLQINNPDECTLFHKVLVPASMGDSKTNPPKNGDYKNVLLYFEADETSWLFSSDGIPTQLVNGMTNYEEAKNLPSINNHTIIGNMTGADLDLQDKLTAGDNIQINGTTISATDTTYNDFVGATSDAAGEAGLVPAPASGVTEKFLKSDGTWSDTTAFLPYPASVNTSGTTQQFIASIQALNAEVGTAFLGTVSLTDLPESMVQEEVMAYVYDNNLIYLTLRSADVAPYIWSCNSYAYRGWEPIDTTAVTVLWANSTESGATRHLYADTSMFDAVSMGDIITAAHKGLIFVRLTNPLTPEQYNESVLANVWVSPNDNDYQVIFTDGNYTYNYGADALTDTAFAYSSGQYQRKLTAGAGIDIAGNTISVRDWEKFARTFDTVADMQAVTNLVAGSYAHTLGYHSLNDGGDAYYKITDTEPSTHYETIAGGLYAELLYLDDTITPSKFGAYHDGTHDDSDAIQDAMDVLGYKAVKILDLEGYTYCVSKPITLPSTYRATVKNGEIKALADFTIDGEDTSKNYIFITSETNTNTYPEAFGTFPTEDLTIDRINLDAGLITGLGCMILNRFLRVNITNCQFKRYTTNGLYLPDKGSHEVNVNNCNFIAFLGSDEEALQIESYGIYNDSLDGMFSHLVIIGGKYGIYNNKGANIFTAIHPYGQLDYTIYHNAGVGCTYDQIYFDGKGMYVNRPWLTTISNSYFLVNATPLTLNRGSDPNTAMKGFKVIGCVANNYSSDLTITAISLPTGSFKVVEECEFDLTTTNMVDNRYLVNVNKIMKPQVVYLDGTQQEISMASNGTITDTATNTKFTKTIVNNVVNVTAFNTTGWSQLGIVVTLESNKTYKIINKYTHDQKDFKVYAYSSIATSETPTVLKSVSNDTIGYQTFDTGANTNFVIALLNKGIYELEITKA